MVIMRWFGKTKGSLQFRLLIYFLIIISILGSTILIVFVNFNRNVKYFQGNFEYNYRIESISIKVTELNELINNFIYGLVVTDYINRYNYEYLQLLKTIDDLQAGTDVNSEIYHMLTDLRNYLYSYNENVIEITENKSGSNTSIDTVQALTDLNLKKNYIVDEVNRILYYNLSASFPVYQNIAERLNRIRNVTIGVIALVILCMYILSLRFARTISRPIHDLAVEMTKFSKDTSISPPEIKTTDHDISVIVDSYMKMTGRINKLIAEIQEKADIEKKLQDKEIQNLRMSELLKQAEMDFLRSQVNPHFLFNTLNIISSLAGMEESKESVAVINRLTAMLRFTMDTTSEYVPLSSELELVKNYMYIQEVRFCGKIEAVYNVNQDITHHLVPRMTLQPLVENSVIHGLEPKVGGGTVTITAQQSTSSLILGVRDDGVGISESMVKDLNSGRFSDSGIGLANLIKRLNHYYGVDSLTISSGNEWGTEIVIEIPIDASDDTHSV